MKNQRCHICGIKLTTWGVSGIESKFLGKKIMLDFSGFLACDKCCDALSAAIKTARRS